MCVSVFSTDNSAEEEEEEAAVSSKNKNLIILLVNFKILYESRNFFSCFFFVLPRTNAGQQVLKLGHREASNTADSRRHSVVVQKHQTFLPKV